MRFISFDVSGAILIRPSVWALAFSSRPIISRN